MAKNNCGTAIQINSQQKPEHENANNRKLLGKNIHIALVMAGLNRSDLAKLLGVTAAAVSLWTSGERVPDIFQLKNIADITKQTTDWFYEEHK